MSTPKWSLLHVRRAGACVLAGVLAAASAGAETPAARVTLFSPQGVVKDVRQVNARFSDPMVPLGDPRSRVEPFAIDCPEAGRGRWVDTRTWAYDFDRDLPAGIECRFTLRPELKTLNGQGVAGEKRFAFSTGGPAVLSSRPFADSTIEEEQAFILQLDGDPQPESVLQHVRFSVDGIREAVGVRLVTGPLRDEILKNVSREVRSGPVVVLQATQRFPSGRKLRLVWGKGVTATSGITSAQDQVLEFKTRKAFTARVSCDREHAKAACIPLLPVRVRFSAPVGWDRARQIVLAGPDGQRRSPEPLDTPQPFVEDVEFKGPFPEQATLRIELPADLRDDAGRTPINADRFPMEITTAAFPPLAKFSSRFGIIESKADPVLPVTLRNLEPEVQARLGRIGGNVERIASDDPAQILAWLRKVGRARRSVSVFADHPGDGSVKAFDLPKPHGADAFEVVGIPFTAPGLYVVELASPRLGASLLGTEAPMYVPAAALVTNMAVHFKWGGETSLVWVTTLDDAQPVGGAQISVHDCTGTAHWSGTTDAQGIARIATLPERRSLPNCYRSWSSAEESEDYYLDYAQTRALGLDEGLFVIARKADDLSVVHSGWNQGIEAWRFQLPVEWSPASFTAHTIFDRSLFRAGETVHMKHLLRTRTLSGFVVPPAAERPPMVTIQHLGSEQKYEFPLTWDDQGVAETAWTIPQEGKLGTYQVTPTRAPAPEGYTPWSPPSGGFRVEEFRVPLMKAAVHLPTEPQVRAASVPVDVTVQYLAGGAADELPVVLRAQIRPREFRRPPEFDRFTFANGAVQEGIRRRGMYDDDDGDADAGSVPEEKPGVHHREDLVLDHAGGARTSIVNIPGAETLRDLLVEAEFRDPNGEVQTAAATVPLWPSKLLAGINAERWAGSGNTVAAKVAVLDTKGEPVANTPVTVEVRQRRYYSHRKRLVGGFYGYESVEEIGPRLRSLCAGHTDARGLFLCEGTAPAQGNLVLEASVADDAGNPSVAHTDVWVSTGERDVWFAAEDSDRMDLLPEQPRYEPGDTARFQVRMPFREATALVTTEREGVLDARVVRLSGKAPVVEVPITDAHAPNMFISVLAVRGRVGDVQPTAMADLGRPAYKLGIAEIQVGWGTHALGVSVNADREVYQVRDRASVRIAVRTVDGTAPPPGSEVAVAAVDEGLLELSANRSWDVLAAMMGRRGYAVSTASAQMQVVGKRHYGVKALPQGGSGGRQSTRELFDTLLLWKGRVPLDGDGNARVEVPLNDSLTSFRIVAVATGDAGQFGSGATSIRSTQDLMLLSGVPPLVREGDRLRAEFTLRNTTNRSMQVTAGGRVEGLPDALAAQTAALAAGSATVIGWDVTVPAGVASLRYEIEAGETGGPSDRLRIAQRVRPAVPVRTLQATLVQLQQLVRHRVQRPDDALPGRGGVRVSLAPTLAAGLDGVQRWMSRYPYSCLEQQVSMAVALNDAARWRSIAASLPAYQDSDGLLKYFPSARLGSEVLTAYVLAVSHAAGFAMPDSVRDKMESGLKDFINGALRREPPFAVADLAIRKLAAVEALARIEKAEPALLSSITIEPHLWPTPAVLDWWSILRRVPVAKREVRLKEVEQIVRARLNLQGTTMGFSTEDRDALWWLMICPDTSSVRLALHLLEFPAWRDDLPQIVRGALGRQRFGTWDCTVTNAWGALAVHKFVEKFEATPVSGSTTAVLGQQSQSADWADPPQPVSIELSWPPGGTDLTVQHSGTGAPWLTIQSQAAIPLQEALSTGYRIRKTVTAIDPKRDGRFSRGDRLRVRVEVEAQSDMTWVVVNDPIPAGASHLGTGLARDSTIAVAGEQPEGEAWLAYAERAFEAYRAYYEFVPKGTFVAEYTIRLNHDGRFHLPPTRVEALYAPEMFGELPNAEVEVLP